jgi:hypothetical protein
MIARDYVETLTDRDTSRDEFIVQPDLGELGEKVARTRERNAQALRDTIAVAAASRAVARDLRRAGLTVDDAAIILGVSRGRISQLTAEAMRMAREPASVRKDPRHLAAPPAAARPS